MKKTTRTLKESFSAYLLHAVENTIRTYCKKKKPAENQPAEASSETEQSSAQAGPEDEQAPEQMPWEEEKE